jgi:hypothetical protein
MTVLAISDAGGYVAAAYGIFVAMIVVYLAIIGPRLRRTARELRALGEHGDKAAR